MKIDYDLYERELRSSNKYDNTPHQEVAHYSMCVILEFL